MALRAIFFADHVTTGRASPTPAALLRLYGMTMIERHLRTLAALGITEMTVIGSSDTGGDLIRHHLAQIMPTVTYLDTQDARWDRCRALGSDAPCLLITAHYLYDPRAFDAVIRSGPNTILVDSSGVSGSETGDSCGLALVDATCLARLRHIWVRSVELWMDLDTLARQGLCRRLDIRRLDPYLMHLRRSIPPFWLVVKSTQDVRIGETALIDAAQKGTLDLPAQFLHPPFENWIVWRLANTPVTPNQVTTVTNLLAFVVTGFLFAGALMPGLLIATLVGVLDGVDGKLARVTVRCSTFGDWFEHILDNVYELSWYWALGWALTRGADRTSLVLSGIMTLFYLLDRTATGTFRHMKGIELFDYTPVDRVFRWIGSRRNINAWVLLIGVLIHAPLDAFQVVTGWMVVTAVFHGWRAIQLLVLSELREG